MGIGLGLGFDIGSKLGTSSDPYGEENVINGTFDTDLSSWTYSAVYWSWVNGRAYQSNQAGFQSFGQECIPANKIVTISFDYEVVQGKLQARVGAVAITGTGLDGSGTFSIVYDNTGGAAKVLDFGRYFPNGEFYIDNVSVKEIL